MHNLVSTAFVLVVAMPACCSEPLGRTHALLVGVDEYYQTWDLESSGNDVELLEHTLRVFCGCDSVHVMTQKSHPRDQPDFAKILAAIQNDLDLANNGSFDTLLVFFAGHGIRADGDGQLYLAPADYIPSMRQLTGIPISMLKERLKACDKVANKFLILDTCHAAAQLTGREIAVKLEGTPGLVTFASCLAGETSIEWPGCQHGLFTYWLCIGLSGWADGSLGKQDGIIDVREILQFVQVMVGRTLDLFAGREGERHIQHPDLIGLSPDQRIRIARVEQHDNEVEITKKLNSAKQFIENGRPVDAIETLNSAMDLKAWDPELCAWRGKAYIRQYDRRRKRPDLEQALADLDTAILLAKHRNWDISEIEEFEKQRTDILSVVGIK